MNERTEQLYFKRDTEREGWGMYVGPQSRERGIMGFCVDVILLQLSSTPHWSLSWERGSRALQVFPWRWYFCPKLKDDFHVKLKPFHGCSEEAPTNQWNDPSLWFSTRSCQLWPVVWSHHCTFVVISASKFLLAKYYLLLNPVESLILVWLDNGAHSYNVVHKLVKSSFWWESPWCFTWKWQEVLVSIHTCPGTPAPLQSYFYWVTSIKPPIL